jgi:hypothetical protein
MEAHIHSKSSAHNSLQQDPLQACCKKDGSTDEGLRWLKPMCDELKPPRSGNKTILIERLVGCFFMNVDEFEECFEGTFNDLLAKWGKAKKKMRDEEAHALSLRAGGTAAQTPREAGFSVAFLALVWHAKKLGVFPEIDDAIPVYQFCGLSCHITSVLEELERIDTTPFETLPANENPLAIPKRRTPTCALRLFQILLGSNHFYERLLKDSADTPNREELHAGAHGLNSDFWVDVRAACVNLRSTSATFSWTLPCSGTTTGHSLI